MKVSNNSVLFDNASPVAGIRAFTLLEVFVVVGIIGVIFSFLVVAVVSTRTAARTISCSNNLRQLGMGLHQFESINRQLPGVYWGFRQTTTIGEKTQWSFSPSSLIAAFIDGGALANAVQIQQPLGVWDPDWANLDLPAPSILHCPSDPLASSESSSYRYCRGNVPLWPEDPGGSFVSYQGIHLSGVTDGLSTTAFASERLISIPQANRPQRDRDLIGLNTNVNNDAAIDCVSLNKSGTWEWYLSSTGTSWMSGRWINASYYHLFPPNSLWVDCAENPSPNMAVTTARSNHPGGVNILYGDGHAMFIVNTVNLRIWRALATRDGSERLED